MPCYSNEPRSSVKVKNITCEAFSFTTLDILDYINGRDVYEVRQVETPDGEVRLEKSYLEIDFNSFFDYNNEVYIFKHVPTNVLLFIIIDNDHWKRLKEAGVNSEEIYHAITSYYNREIEYLGYVNSLDSFKNLLQFNDKINEDTLFAVGCFEFKLSIYLATNNITENIQTRIQNQIIGL